MKACWYNAMVVSTYIYFAVLLRTYVKTTYWSIQKQTKESATFETQNIFSKLVRLMLCVKWKKLVSIKHPDLAYISLLGAVAKNQT